MVKNFLCCLFICACQFTLTAEAQVIEEIKTAGQIYAYAQIPWNLAMIFNLAPMPLKYMP